VETRPVDRIRVLEADPELAAALDEAERAEASRAALAPLLRVECGGWRPPERVESGHMGLLVLGGLLTRTVAVGGPGSVQLLATGDVLRPWVTLEEDAPVDLNASWTVLETATLANLDAAFGRRVARWPSIASALMDRIVTQTRWLALDLAVSHIRRVDDRLMLVFWQFARRFGRVTPDGVVIPLDLQHQLLATLIGAQRPSVTTRLGVLREHGLIDRRPDGTWLMPNGNGIAVLEMLDAALPAPALA
jgi:CRP/FNR family transcriptional regulator, cyclic AMP receptor protein